MLFAVARENDKKAVQSQRWPRAKWIEWAVAEIWPFEIIQDGRQLGFDVTGNSAIRFADPENAPCPREPNIKCIGSPVAEIWPFAYLGGIYGTTILGEGRS